MANRVRGPALRWLVRAALGAAATVCFLLLFKGVASAAPESKTLDPLTATASTVTGPVTKVATGSAAGLAPPAGATGTAPTAGTTTSPAAPATTPSSSAPTAPMAPSGASSLTAAVSPRPAAGAPVTAAVSSLTAPSSPSWAAAPRTVPANDNPAVPTWAGAVTSSGSLVSAITSPASSLTRSVVGVVTSVPETAAGTLSHSVGRVLTAVRPPPATTAGLRSPLTGAVPVLLSGGSPTAVLSSVVPVGGRGLPALTLPLVSALPGSGPFSPVTDLLSGAGRSVTAAMSPLDGALGLVPPLGGSGATGGLVRRLPINTAPASGNSLAGLVAGQFPSVVDVARSAGTESGAVGSAPFERLSPASASVVAPAGRAGARGTSGDGSPTFAAGAAGATGNELGGLPLGPAPAPLPSPRFGGSPSSSGQAGPALQLFGRGTTASALDSLPWRRLLLDRADHRSIRLLLVLERPG